MKTKWITVCLILGTLAYLPTQAQAITAATARIHTYDFGQTVCDNYDYPTWSCHKYPAVYPECFATGKNQRDIPQWDCVVWFDQILRHAESIRRCVMSDGIDPYNKLIWASIQYCVSLN